jgi:hypothetical protein
MANMPAPRVGKKYRFRNQEFQAINGLVHIEDRQTGDFKAVTQAEMVARAIGFRDALKHIDYPDEREELSRCVLAIRDCVLEAKNQGDPMDPEAAKQVARENRPIQGMMDGGAVRLRPPTGQKKSFILNDQSWLKDTSKLYVCPSHRRVSENLEL